MKIMFKLLKMNLINNFINDFNIIEDDKFLETNKIMLNQPNRYKSLVKSSSKSTKSSSSTSKSSESFNKLSTKLSTIKFSKKFSTKKTLWKMMWTLSGCLFIIMITFNQIHLSTANPLLSDDDDLDSFDAATANMGSDRKIINLNDFINGAKSLQLTKRSSSLSTINHYHNHHRRGQPITSAAAAIGAAIDEDEQELLPQPAPPLSSSINNDEDDDLVDDILTGSIPRIQTGQVIQPPSADSASFMENMMLMANLSDEPVVRLNPKDCIFVKTEEGIYSLVSEDDSNMVCGLYLMAQPNQLVEIEFLQFNVSCHKNGLLSIVNGWELMGQFFPSVEDHPVPREKRYQEFCGQTSPPLRKIYRMSQNVGLVEYRIPNPGQGFIVKIRFIENPKPCNTIVQLNYGIYTLKNYGRRINCTMSILDVGATFRILSMNVGQSYRRLDNILHSPRNHIVETGVIKKCKKRGMEDYVEFRGGNGLDTQLMQVGDDVCGFRQFPYKKRFTLLCTNTAVRMVSSGNYDNQIEFSFETMLEPDQQQQQQQQQSSLSSPISLICPKPPV